MSGRPSTRKKLAFAALAVALALATVELGARLYLRVRSGRSGPDAGAAVVDREHPLRYELAPGRSMPASGPTAHINSAGLRGPEPRALGERTRVLCVGDSCTFGYAPDVDDSSTYPAHLQRILDERQPGRFDVLNAGMPSFCALDCLSYTLWKGLELRPDAVVLMVGWNDTHHCQPLDRLPGVDSPPLFEASAAYRLAKSWAIRLRGARPADAGAIRSTLRNRPRPTDHLSEVMFTRYERVLGEFARACRDRHIPITLVTLPNFARPGWGDLATIDDVELRLMAPHLVGGELSPGGWRRFIEATNAAVRRAAAGPGVSLVEGSKVADMSMFVDICHLNSAGNAALASRVAVVLQNMPMTGSEPAKGPR